MGGKTSVMQEKILSRFKDRRDQLKYGTVLFLVLSLIFSILNGWIFSIGWLVLGVMGLLLLYRLVPRYFFLAFWLISIYILIFLGATLSFNFAERSGSWFLKIIGYSIIAGSFILVLYLIIYIKERRDEYALDGTYVPIGLWTIFVFAFFWSSIFSILGWTRWADSSFGNPLVYKSLYFMAELIAIPLFVKIVYFPEERFKATYLDEEPELGGIIEQIKSFTGSISGKKLRREDKVRKMEVEINCPLCGKGLEKQVMECPSCGSQRFFYWCDVSDEYFVRCPNCRRLTPIGKNRCIHCSIRMSKRIRCSNCNSVNDLYDWIGL